MAKLEDHLLSNYAGVTDANGKRRKIVATASGVADIFFCHCIHQC